MQLTCDYCGATYRVPSRNGVDILHCTNHPERFAVGTCDDCNQNFCNGCLRIFDFRSRDSSAVLHLCPSCLRKRETGRANSFVFVGTLTVLLGIAVAFGFMPIGAFLIAVGFIEMVFGVLTRAEEAKFDEGAIAERSESPSPPQRELEETELGEADLMYDELLDKYTEHWGLPGGPRLLDKEIKACTWRGDSFEEAVAKIYRRQLNKR